MIANMTLEEFCRAYIAGNIEITIKKHDNIEISPPVDASADVSKEAEKEAAEEVAKEDEFPLETNLKCDSYSVKLEYFPGTKQVRRRSTYNENNMLHSIDDTPAEYFYDENGCAYKFVWYINGVVGRSGDNHSVVSYEDGSTEIKLYKNGDKYVIRDNKKPNFEVFKHCILVREKWLNEEGKLHREIPEGPARIDYVNGKKVKQTFCLRGGKEFVYDVKPEAQ